MFSVSIETCFEASHRLKLRGGGEEELHKHDWQVTVEVSREGLDESGFVIDFRQLRSMVEKIVSELEGTLLEEHEYFARNSASAEHVCKYIYGRFY